MWEAWLLIFLELISVAASIAASVSPLSVRSPRLAVSRMRAAMRLRASWLANCFGNRSQALSRATSILAIVLSSKSSVIIFNVLQPRLSRIFAPQTLDLSVRQRTFRGRTWVKFLAQAANRDGARAVTFPA